MMGAISPIVPLFYTSDLVPDTYLTIGASMGVCGHNSSLNLFVAVDKRTDLLAV